MPLQLQNSIIILDGFKSEKYKTKSIISYLSLKCQTFANARVPACYIFLSDPSPIIGNACH